MFTGRRVILEGCVTVSQCKVAGVAGLRKKTQIRQPQGPHKLPAGDHPGGRSRPRSVSESRTQRSRPGAPEKQETRRWPQFNAFITAVSTSPKRNRRLPAWSLMKARAPASVANGTSSSPMGPSTLLPWTNQAWWMSTHSRR